MIHSIRDGELIAASTDIVFERVITRADPEGGTGGPDPP